MVHIIKRDDKIKPGTPIFFFIFFNNGTYSFSANKSVSEKILFTSKNMVKITLYSIIGGLLLDILQYLSWLFMTIFFSIGEL